MVLSDYYHTIDFYIIIMFIEMLFELLIGIEKRYLRNKNYIFFLHWYISLVESLIKNIYICYLILTLQPIALHYCTQASPSLRQTSQFSTMLVQPHLRNPPRVRSQLSDRTTPYSLRVGRQPRLVAVPQLRNSCQYRCPGCTARRSQLAPRDISYLCLISLSTLFILSEIKKRKVTLILLQQQRKQH